MDPTRQTLLEEVERLLKAVDDHLATAADSADERPNRPFHGEALRVERIDEALDVTEFETPWQTKAQELKVEMESLFGRLPPEARDEAREEARDEELNIWPCPPEVLTARRDDLAAVRAWLLSPPGSVFRRR